MLYLRCYLWSFMHQCHWFCLLYTRDYKNLNKVRLQNSRGFFLKISKQNGKVWRKSLTRTKQASLTRPYRACEAREKKNVSPQSRSLFSASFQTFCLTARAYLNTQKYGLFCSLKQSQRSQLGVCVLLLALLCCLSLLRFIETAKKNQQYVGPLKWESRQK